jgi:hypothetical protein
MSDSVTSLNSIPSDLNPSTTSAALSTFDSLKNNVRDFFKSVPASMGVFSALLVLLAVLLFNHKSVYRFTNKNLSDLVGKTMDEEKDCPNQRGLIVHSIVAALVAGLLVYLLHDYMLDKIKSFLA